MLRSLVRNTLLHQLKRPQTVSLARTGTIAPTMRSWTPFRQSFNTSSVQWKQFTITELTTERYHKLSDELLEHMCANLEELADSTTFSGFDVEYNQGVMTISVGNHGTYVINKQPPNHQIWLSSPVSGPQRYDFDETHHKWFYHRDNHTLDQVLNTELSQAMGEQIDVLHGFKPEEK